MTKGDEHVDACYTLIKDLPASHRAWLSASQPVTLHENTAIVAVPDDFTRSQLETRLRPRLEDALSRSLGQPVRLAVTVDPTLGDGELGPVELDDVEGVEAVDPMLAEQAP